MKQFFKTLFYGLCLMIVRGGRFFGYRNGPVVLMYHAVNVEGGKLSVAPEAFRRHMEYLRTHRNIVSMGELLSFIKGGKALPHDAVVVTIDDGYLDTYREAFPILKEFKVPFTLFLTTNMSPLQPLGGLPRPTWDQLREMSAIGLMDVGLHGHNHLHVDEIAGDKTLLDKELGDSAIIIEREMGASPKVYAYAFGARDERVPAYLRSIGIQAAFGITDGTVTFTRDLYALPRVQIDSTMSDRLFRYRTTGAVDIAFLIKRNLRRLATQIWKRSP